MLADYQSLVDNLVRDLSGSIDAAERDQAIELARIRYSTDRPLRLIDDVTVDASGYLPLPAGWQQDFSRLQAVKRGRVAVDVEQLRTSTGDKLRLDDTLRQGDSVAVEYTAMHELSAAADSIPLVDREAVAAYATSIVLEQMANLFSGHRSSSMDADSVDYQSKGRDYASRAKTMRSRYLDHMGVDTRRVVPAGAVVDFDQRDSRGRDRLIHRQDRR